MESREPPSHALTIAHIDLNAAMKITVGLPGLLPRSEIVVADTSPLNYLVQINREHILTASWMRTMSKHRTNSLLASGQRVPRVPSGWVLLRDSPASPLVGAMPAAASGTDARIHACMRSDCALSPPRRSACADCGAGTPRSFRRGFDLTLIASVQVGHGGHRSAEPPASARVLRLASSPQPRAPELGFSAFGPYFVPAPARRRVSQCHLRRERPSLRCPRLRVQKSPQRAPSGLHNPGPVSSNDASAHRCRRCAVWRRLRALGAGRPPCSAPRRTRPGSAPNVQGGPQSGR